LIKLTPTNWRSSHMQLEYILWVSRFAS
jgi:hypothetical protein